MFYCSGDCEVYGSELGMLHVMATCQTFRIYGSFGVGVDGNTHFFSLGITTEV